MKGTTIICVSKGGEVAMAGDGQVTMGEIMVKMSARKVRKIFHDSVLTGFAGATSDALTLFEKFERKLEQYNGNLTRAAVELSKDWRTDRILRRLDALLAVADINHSLIISGTGDVIEPDDGIIAIGSGSGFARAAAKALLKHSSLKAVEIATDAIEITAEICIYTNKELVVESLRQEKGVGGQVSKT